MKIALTGGSGFLGRELYKQLKAEGHECVLLLRETSVPPDNAPCRRVDFKEGHAFKEALEGCEVLLHAVGVTNGSNEVLEEVNKILTTLLMTSLPDSIKRVVYISSAAAHMRKGPYGMAKLRAEEEVKTCGREWVLLRPTMIYGPGDNKNLAMMVDWVTKRFFVPVLGGGKFKVQPVHVEDAAQACVAACTKEVSGSTFNVCGPEQISLKTMLEELKQRSKSSCIFISVPLKPVQIFLSFWAWLFPTTSLPVKQVKELDKHEAFEYTETSQRLNYHPRRFQDGLDWLN